MAKSLLWVYIGFITYLTLLGRESSDQYQYNFSLFWSYKSFFDDVQPQGMQIVLNIFFFIPFGALTFFCVKGNKKKKIIITAVFAFFLSGIIEVLQLCLKLGFAEFDDIFNNTLGAILGAIIMYVIIKRGEENDRT